MARERAKLSDKQERILVQAQLMGLTARDMQQIGNRLIALQREAEEKTKISDAIYGYSWIKDSKNHWVITTPDGYACKFVKTKTGRTQYYTYTWDYNVTVNKPGTAFKTRYLQKQGVTTHNDLKAKLCPEKAKDLYSMICWLNTHLQHVIKNEK